jgi:hypothetical protein
MNRPIPDSSEPFYWRGRYRGQRARYRAYVRVTTKTHDELMRIANRRGVTIKAVLEMLLEDLPQPKQHRRAV